MTESTKPVRKVKSRSRATRKAPRTLAGDDDSKRDYHLVMTVAGEFFVERHVTLEKLAESVVNKLKESYLSPVRVLVFYGDQIQCLHGGNPLFPVIEFKHERLGEQVSTIDVVKATLQEVTDGVLFGAADSEDAQDTTESDDAETGNLFGF